MALRWIRWEVITLRFEYFADLDRFAVCRGAAANDADKLTQPPGYASLEYLRYVPMGGVSLAEIAEALVRVPRELCCEITIACNLACRVCIANASSVASSHLPVDKFEDFVSHMPSDVVRVTISGGEPTLHPDLSRFVECCSLAGKHVVLSTNGYDVDGVARLFSSADGVLVAVSLHGLRAVHDRFVGRPGSYERALETIVRAASAGRRVHVLSTATEETLPSLGQLTYSLADIPIVEHRISLVKAGGRLTGCTVSYEQVCQAIDRVQTRHKLSVKRRDQPRLFLNHQGTLEARSERNY